MFHVSSLCQQICEEYIAGREVRCALVEEDDGSLTMLPMTEYILEDIRTSAHKLAVNENGCPLVTSAAIVKTDGDRHCPPQGLDDTTCNAIYSMACKAHTALGCTDFSLYDIRINDQGTPYFLEACNFCSFSPKSSMVSMCNVAGRPHPEVFHMVMERAISRKPSTNTTRAIGMM